MRQAITRLHARVQRPGRHRDTAGAGGGEQSDRRDPGQRDLHAGPPVQPLHAAPEHGAKEHGVTGDREQLGAAGDAEPRRIAVFGAPTSGKARQLR